MKIFLLVAIVAALASNYVQAQMTATVTINADGSLTLTSNGQTINIPANPTMSKIIAYLQDLLAGGTGTTEGTGETAASSEENGERRPRCGRGGRGRRRG